MYVFLYGSSYVFIIADSIINYGRASSNLLENKWNINLNNYSKMLNMFSLSLSKYNDDLILEACESYLFFGIVNKFSVFNELEKFTIKFAVVTSILF